MKAEKLLDAIGEISDQLITEADPTQKKSEKPNLRNLWSWARIGSVAAVFVFCCIAAWAITSVSFRNKASFDTATTESAAIPEDAYDIIYDDSNTEDGISSAEDDSDNIQKSEMDNEATYDVAYTIVVNDSSYYDLISFENLKDYHIIPEDATGLTEENAYKITEQDLGTVIGTVTDCVNEELIGATLYHYAQYPDDLTIGILEHDGDYSFYTKQFFH